MADLVSVQEAQRALRWPDSQVSTQHEELQSLIDRASAIVVAHCDTTAYWRAITATWTETTVPQTVKAAILKQVVYLDRHRGDEERPSQDDGLAPGVKAMLWLTRDPVLG